MTCAGGQPAKSIPPVQGMVLERLPDGAAVVLRERKAFYLFHGEEAQAEIFLADFQVANRGEGGATVDEDQHIDGIHDVDPGSGKELSGRYFDVQLFFDLAG